MEKFTDKSNVINVLRRKCCGSLIFPPFSRDELLLWTCINVLETWKCGIEQGIFHISLGKNIYSWKTLHNVVFL